jgi:hypothetical protein
MTKTALQREAQQAELARQDFVVMRAAVKATEVVLPFVFYDGTNTPGGRCRIKKGEQVWLFLDKARKVGAELGVGGDRSRRDWARVSVDDLMLVRGEVILPHVSFSAPVLEHWLTAVTALRILPLSLQQGHRVQWSSVRLLCTTDQGNPNRH